MTIYNFSAGPAVLPEGSSAPGAGGDARLARQRHVGDGDVATAARNSWASHAQAEADLRELLDIPANYKVLFLQGGATSSSPWCR